MDPLGGMEVSEKGFARMTQILMEIAEATAQGKLVFTLEGGYNVAAQRRSVKAVLEEISQASPLQKMDLLDKEKAHYPQIEPFVLQLKEIQRRYWKSL
jgi:acetoin utilization deacetylase AcuC-like enzyme